MKVFVLDKNKQALDPCSERRARILLTKKKAAVFKRFPFTIILKERTLEESITHDHRIKIDPGSKHTGITITQEKEESSKVVFACEIEHRGHKVKMALEDRRNVRRSRRQRKTRYRKCRFLNRAASRRKGWIAPSLMSRVYNIITWVRRFSKICPIIYISQELNKFNTQKMQNPEITGIEYQQGELQGCDIREYLLEKFGRKCVYCGKGNCRLEIEHTHPRSKGGSNRVSNLVLGCHECNQSKGNQKLEEFLRDDPKLLKKIQLQLKVSLKDAAAVNVIRNELRRRLQEIDPNLEVSTGSRTKYNRYKNNLPKKHWIDAACVGDHVPDNIKEFDEREQILKIKAMGHGRRIRCRINKYGFPILHFSTENLINGIKTGYIIMGKTTRGKNKGFHIGRVVVSVGNNAIYVDGICVNKKESIVLQKGDGYSFH